MTPVFDTNILIDYLAGRPAAKDELARYANARISMITWIVVMVGAKNKKEETAIREFLNSFETIPLDEQVAETAVQIRRQHRLRLPDALIWSSARTRDALLITRDIGDYLTSEPDIRIPYTL